MPEQAKAQKHIIGVVKSDRMEKTIVVDVVRMQKHRKYEKYLRRNTRMYAHDGEGLAQVGDRVEIRPIPPKSKLKRWELVRVLKHGEV
ncbi:MAG: 30S ribosomal protein S17 [Planctomycetota bacterium]|nr:MAG: 30S ribosomal protein S17 [Planctomycetota bacterium]